MSSSTTGTCNYTVQAGDTSSDLTVLSISGTIADSASNAMSNFVPTTNLAANKALIIDTTSPTVTESTSITTPTTDTTPDYIFSTTEAGTISYGGSCTSATTSATSGSNTITFTALTDGTYSDCTITVTDTATNASSTLSVADFTIDTTIPTISSIASNSSTTENTITWTTNENSSSQLSYGLTTSYGTTTTESDTSTRVTSHSVSISNLTCATTYHFRVISKDSLENTSANNDNAFTTSSCPSSIISSGSSAVSRAQNLINMGKIDIINRQNLNNENQNKSINNLNLKFTKTVKPGVKHNEVKKLQEFLNNNGFELAKDGPGSKGQETVMFGQLSKNALAKFQASKGLKPDGVFGPLTRKTVNDMMKNNI